MFVVCLTGLGFVSSAALSQTENVALDLAVRMGGAGFNVAYIIDRDPLGNIYTTGAFTGTVDFDPGPGEFNLTSAGGSDIYVCKLDSNGNFVWAKRMGGPRDDAGYFVAVDADGDVYVTGYFGGAVDFNPGTGTTNLTSAGDDDVFVLKLNTNGSLLWARRVGGPESDRGFGITVDVGRNVYFTGYFSSTVDFNPGSGAFNLVSAGSADVFVCRLDPEGGFVWAKRMGGAGEDIPYFLLRGPADSLYMTGYFESTADFDPGPGVFNMTSAGGPDIFVVKLDVLGGLVWAKRLGGARGDLGTGMAVDAAGNVYTTGWYGATADFDPGPGVFNLTATGGFSDDDIYVSKLDANGDFVWARSMGGTDFIDSGWGVAVDTAGNVYASGYFGATADFDPGPGVSTLVASGDTDAFLLKLDANGDFMWATRFGGTDFVECFSIVLDPMKRIYLTGRFGGTVDFDPGPANFDLSSVAGSEDVFILRLEQTDVELPDFASLDGHILDSAGNPLSCATARVLGNVDGGDVEFIAATGFDGRYVFPSLSLTDFSIDVFAPGFLPIHDVIPVEAFDSETGSLAMDYTLAAGTPSPETTVSGRVVDSQDVDGTVIIVPLSGVRVEALLDGLPFVPPIITYTCADGRYELTGLPAGKVDANVSLRFNAPNYLEETRVAPAPGQPLDVTLEKSGLFPYTVTGAVRVAGAVTPIADARVAVQRTDGAIGFNVTTNSEGLYAVLVPDEGEYLVDASAAGYESNFGYARVSMSTLIARADVALARLGGGEGEGEGPGPGCFGAQRGRPSAAGLVGDFLALLTSAGLLASVMVCCRVVK